MATRRWQLRRNCALTPTQALLAWAVPVLLLLAVAGVAAGHGWWWVAGFALADIAALAAACAVYARHALDGETLVLGDDGMLRIEQQRGQRRVSIAWPAWRVRLEAEAGGLLLLRAGGEQLRVGAQCCTRERERAARELRHSLGLDGPAGTAVRPWR